MIERRQVRRDDVDAGFKSWMDGVDSSIDNLNTNVQNLQNDVSNLQNDVSNLQSDVQNLQTQVSDLQGQVLPAVHLFYDMLPEGPVTDLPADSTGVKYICWYRLPTRYLKDIASKRNVSLRITALLASLPSDATVQMEAFLLNAGDVLASGTASQLSDVSITISNSDLQNLPDDDYLAVRFNVTTASGTSGATFDVKAVVAELTEY